MQFDGNLEGVLTSLSTLSRQLEENEEIKLSLKYLGLICVGTVAQTLLDAAKADRKHVYKEYIESEYDSDAVQKNFW